VVGRTREQVRAAVGEPDDVFQTPQALPGAGKDAGPAEVWLYHDRVDAEGKRENDVKVLIGDDGNAYRVERR
jgi:hypothetical protein